MWKLPVVSFPTDLIIPQVLLEVKFGAIHGMAACPGLQLGDTMPWAGLLLAGVAAGTVHCLSDSRSFVKPCNSSKVTMVSPIGKPSSSI
jgi:hypothetical protein